MTQRKHTFRQSDFGVDVLKDIGPYCKNCRKRAKWTDLTTKYEIDGHRQIWRIRFCRRCGKMLDETNMDDLALRLQATERETIRVSSGDQSSRVMPRVIDFRRCV